MALRDRIASIQLALKGASALCQPGLFSSYSPD
jgi:hypothetical protein